MNEPEAFRKPIKLELQDIPEHYDQLNFLVDKASKPTDIKEVKISVKAGELVGKLYDALHAQYQNPSDTESQKALNVLCVRIVFCLYAEDAGIFGGGGSIPALSGKMEVGECPGWSHPAV